jgi:gluconokinase
VLAVDVGSSSVRCAVYDARGRPVGPSEVRHAYRTRSGADGTSEVAPDQLIRTTVRSITEALGASRVSVAGVGVSTFWHGLLAADEKGTALTPLYLWSDRRSSRAAEALRARLDAEAVRQRTGCPIHSSYWPAKLVWLRDERPDLWRRRVRWMSFGDLLFSRLFGSAGTSLSMASATGLLRLDRPEWDGELLRVLRLDPETLPPISEREHGLRAPYRRAWPGLATVPWFHALGDGALANLGSGCVTLRRRSVTIGTSSAVRVMHGAPVATPIPQGLWRYRLDARRLVTGGALSSGGNVRAWLVRSLALDEPQLETALRRARPGSHGLTVLPFLAGERSPGYAANAAGAVRGLSLATLPVDVGRAGVEAVTIEIARVNRLLDQAAPRAAELVASGGALLASRAWMQLIADATGTAVVVGAAHEASSRGAALFALERLGLMAQGHAGQIDGGRTFRPRPPASEAFAAAAERQAALYRELISEPSKLDAPT